MSITLELPSTASESKTDVGATVSVPEKNVIVEVTEALRIAENLPPEELQQVEDFAKQIDLHSREVITRYGEAAQRKLATFADNALQGVRGRDIGAIGDLLSEMSVSIKDFNNESDGNFLKVFRSMKRRAEILQVKYSEVTNTLERIRKELLGRRTTLLVDIKMLDDMYQQNLEYYRELTMYILAGEQKLAETRSGELEDLRQKAMRTADQSDTFAYNDLNDQCESFEKQLHDLRLTRTICLQTAPQIRLIQKTDEQLARKIQSSVNNTIPIWKQKIAIALAIQHSEDAAKMQKQITDLTSEMMMENAKKLRTSAVAAAKESERGIIDIEAIKVSNNELLSTIDDIITVQEEGRRKRAEAEVELRKVEDDLKRKLIGKSQQRS